MALPVAIKVYNMERLTYEEIVSFFRNLFLQKPKKHF